MKKWIDMTRWIKSKAPGQANTPFPYSSPDSSLLNFIPPYGVLVGANMGLSVAHSTFSHTANCSTGSYSPSPSTPSAGNGRSSCSLVSTQPYL